eukprot:1765128-Pleurochrysis_carterae.AAC.1
MRADGGVKIFVAAYVKAKAETYLPKPLEENLLHDTPSTPQLVKDYEIAARKEHYVDFIFQKNYQSKVGVLIYAPPCGQPGETYAIGILALAVLIDSLHVGENIGKLLI